MFWLYAHLLEIETAVPKANTGSITAAVPKRPLKAAAFATSYFFGTAWFQPEYTAKDCG